MLRLLFFVVVLHACVHDLVYPPSPADSSLLLFTQLLETATCLSVRVQFLTTDPSPIPVSTLGDFETIQVDCGGNTLEVLQTLEVKANTTADFSGCGFESETTLMEVQGRVTVSGCWAVGLQRRGFQVSGELLVSNCHFEGNKNSIFSCTNFGFSLVVTDSEFTNNHSPQGTVLFFQPAGSSDNSTTWIAFDHCQFRDNAADLVGSFMYAAVANTNYFSAVQLQERKTLSITNSVVDNSSGYLWYLQLNHLNVSFQNNTVQNVGTPIFLALFDSSFTMTNTTFRNTSRPFFCTYVGGLVLLDGVFIEGVSNGPALMVLNQAPFGLGQVVMRNVDMAMVNQVEFSWFVSTIYALAVPITVENVLVHSGFSFAAACGAYFFSVSAVNHCTVTNMTVVQGGLIGHVFGQGTAYNLNMTNTNTILGGCFLILGANIAFRNLTLVIPQGYSMPTLNGMYSFHDGNASLIDAYAYVPTASNQYLIEADNEELYLARLYWNQMQSVTLLKVSRSHVVAEELSAGKVDLTYFASVIMKSSLQLHNISLESPSLSGGFISATTQCNVTVTNITIHRGSVQSFISSFSSFVQASQISLFGIQGSALFIAYLSSVLTVTNLTVEQSSVDLVWSVRSTVSISSAVLTNVTADKALIRLQLADFSLRRVQMTGFTGTAPSPLGSALSSNLTVSHCQLLSLLSREQGLMQLTDSSISLQFTSVRLFNVTFLQLQRSLFTILNCTVTAGGLKFMSADAKVQVSAGFIEGSDSSGSIQGTYFGQVSGTNGGCVALTGTGGVSVSASVFENCWAKGKGGVLYAVDTSVEVADTEMRGNAATEGGSVYFECVRQCSCLLRNCHFSANSAIQGGVVKWTQVRPQTTNVTSEGCTAVYGDFEASLPTHPVLLNSDTQYMKGVAGVVVVQPILIGLLDAIGQLVKTDNQSAVQLLSSNLVGTTYVMASNGVGNFSSVIVQTYPSAFVVVQAFSPSINQTFPESAYSQFVYDTRNCLPGEVYSHIGCYLCPSLSFSVNPIEGECRACPDYATCPGGTYLDLDQGYWRPSELSSDVYLCPVKSSCLGGQNSTCAEGYSDKLCAKCATGYYLVGLSSCIACESLAVRGARIAIFLLVVIVLYILFVRRSPSSSSAGKSVTVMTTLKILFTYIHSILMISVINVDWKQALTGLFSAVEMFLSFAISSFSLECFWRKFHIDGEMSPIYLKSVFALCLPFGLILINLGVFFLLFHMGWSRNAFRRCCQSSIMILSVIHPYVVKTTMQLVSCREVDNHTLWLSADIALQCWTVTHYKYVLSIFLPTFLLYILGVPVLFAGLLIKLRTSVYSYTLIYLTSGYHDTYYYWEVVVTVRKALLLLSLSMLGSAAWIIQNLVALVLLYVCLEWHIRTSPYKDPLHNRLETVSIFLQMALIATSFYFNADLKLNSNIQLAMGIVLFVVLALFAILCLALMTAQMLMKAKSVAIHALTQDLELSGVKVPPPSFVSWEQSLELQSSKIA